MFDKKFIRVAIIAGMFIWSTGMCAKAALDQARIDVLADGIRPQSPELAEGISTIGEIDIQDLGVGQFNVEKAVRLLCKIEPTKVELERFKRNHVTTENDQVIAALLQQDEIIDALLEKVSSIYTTIGHKGEIDINKKMSFARYGNFSAGVRSIIYNENSELKLELTERDYDEVIRLAKSYSQHPYKAVEILKSEIEVIVEDEGVAKLQQYYQLEEAFKQGIRTALSR